MTGYVSLPMARRLAEAGVVMETSKYYVESADDGFMLTDKPPGCWVAEIRPFTIPAPSLAELWAWLPKYIDGKDCVYVLNMKKSGTHTKAGYIWEPGYETVYETDSAKPADALGELCLWLQERGK